MELRKISLATLAALGAGMLSAAPIKGDVVAEGFPVWQNVDENHYISGRDITQSDLRHKITVVIEMDLKDDGKKKEPAKKGSGKKAEGDEKIGRTAFQTQLLEAGNVASIDPLTATHFGANWETRVLPRDIMVLISIRGGGKDVAEAVREAMKMKVDEADANRYASVRSQSVAIYSDVTFDGGPDTAGKRPCVYVLGPTTGTSILFQGALDADALKGVKGAISKAKGNMTKDSFAWVPFFGSLPEEKRPSDLVKTLARGKNAKMCPLSAVEKVLLKDVASKDQEKASAAQIAYDALEQTRSDLLMRVNLEARECPHRAAWDLQQLVKYWPKEKKRLEAVATRLQSNPEMSELAKMFCKLMVWADPEFTVKNKGEANKIIKDLTAMKKKLEKLKESKVIVVQNGALLMDTGIDELISALPSRVPEK